jgi:hypothetical protein
MDAIRSERGDWQLSELELIEPCLYFRFDPEAPARFARAVHALHTNGRAR